MSVAVCRGPAVPAFVEAPSWMRPAELYNPEPLADDRPAQVDIWNAIQADVAVDNGAKEASKPYVVNNPSVRRSSSSSSRLMSQRSLEICTESLGCETGSGDFTDMSCLFAPQQPPAAAAEAEEESFWQPRPSAAQEKYYSDESSRAVKYHRPGGTRAFPPPLPSMSSRDGPCLKMRPRRQDGRLVVEAVAVRPRGFLEATRHGGRLRLSFIQCSARAGQSAPIEAASYFPVVEDKSSCEQEEEEVAMEVEEEQEEEEDEEEVEVVDRGTMVEVKVSSSQPQAPAAAKVHRSTLVINKFVGSTPLDQPRCHAGLICARDEAATRASALRRVPSSTTTLAAAVAVASAETGDEDDGRAPQSAMADGTKQQQLLLFTSRRGDRHDLLQSVRRCRQLRQKPLFILEPYCIAAS